MHEYLRLVQLNLGGLVEEVCHIVYLFLLLLLLILIVFNGMEFRGELFSVDSSELVGLRSLLLDSRKLMLLLFKSAFLCW